MTTHQLRAAALRNNQSRHYNCCQSVLIPFSEDTVLSEETAFALTAHFGSGMRRGSICGAVTGGLMALGLLGCGEDECRHFLLRFETEHGSLDCARLLKQASDRNLDRKCHCDEMVDAAVRLVDELAPH